MAMQLGALRSALIDAGASPEKADKASEELASYETRLSGIDRQLAVMTTMIAGLYAVAIPVAYLLVRIALKTGALG